MYASPLTTIQSQAQQNALVDDIYAILNSPWPEQYGGTGQTDGSPTLAEIQALIDSVAAVPVGSLHVTTGTVLPDGYIFANGGSYSRSTYDALWAWVQTSGNLAASQGEKTVGQYGPGNGSSTFTVPNLTEYFLRGSGGERDAGSVQSDEIREHNHPATFSGNAVPPHSHTLSSGYNNGNFSFPNRAAQTGGGNISTSSAGGHTPSGTVTVQNRGGSETRPKNIAYPYMIKV